MPPKRGTRSTATKEPLNKKEDTVPIVSTRETRASRRAASQVPIEAQQPAAEILDTKPLPTKRITKAAAAKKSGKQTEITTATEPEEAVEAPLVKKGKGKAKVLVDQTETAGVPPAPTRSRARKTKVQVTESDAAIEIHPPKRAGRKTAKKDVVEEAMVVAEPKITTPSKRTSENAELDIPAEDTPKLRKIQSGPISNSKTTGGDAVVTEARTPRTPKHKKASSPFSPLTPDPFVSLAIELQAVVQTEKVEASTVAEAVPKNGRSLRTRKAQSAQAQKTTTVQRSTRARSTRGKAAHTEPIVPKNDAAAEQNEVDSQVMEEAQTLKTDNSQGTNEAEQPNEEVEPPVLKTAEAPKPKGRRGRKPKTEKLSDDAVVVIEETPTSVTQPVNESSEVSSEPLAETGEVVIAVEEPAVMTATNNRGKRAAKAQINTPVRRSVRTNKINAPEEVEEVDAADKVDIEEDAHHEDAEEKTQAEVKKPPPKKKAVRKPAKGRGRKIAKKIIQLSDNDDEEKMIEDQLEHTIIHGQAETGVAMDDAAEQIDEASATEGMVVETEAVAAPVELPIVASPQGDEVAQQDADDDEEDYVLPAAMSTPLPAPVVLSPTPTSRFFTEPTKAHIAMPSSPLARFGSPLLITEEADLGIVAARSSTPNRALFSEPHTPHASARKAQALGIFTTPSQVVQRSTTYTPKGTIKHLDVASSPILQPPQNLVDDEERSGKSPVKNATPRSSLDPLTARNLFGSVESHRWTADSPSRRSSGGSPMKRHSLSFTEYKEDLGGAESEPEEETAAVSTQEDVETQIDEASMPGTPPTQITKDEPDSNHNESDLSEIEMDDIQSQNDLEENDIDMDEQEATEEGGEASSATKANEEDAVNDSAFNDDSLFAVPTEETPKEESEIALNESTFNDNSLFAIPSEDNATEHTGDALNKNTFDDENTIEIPAADLGKKVTEDALNESTVYDRSLCGSPIEDTEIMEEADASNESTVYDQSLSGFPIEDVTEILERADVPNKSTVNVNSLFAVTAEDATIAQGTMDDMHKDSGENHEDEAVVETADQTEGLNLPSIDAMKALLPSQAREFFEETFPDICDITFTQEPSEIRNRALDFVQRFGVRETDSVGNLSAMFPFGALDNASNLNASNIDVSAMLREWAREDAEARSGGPVGAENSVSKSSEKKEGGEEAKSKEEVGAFQDDEEGEDILPEFMTSPEFSNLDSPPRARTTIIPSSPNTDSAIAPTLFSDDAPENNESEVEADITWDDHSSAFASDINEEELEGGEIEIEQEFTVAMTHTEVIKGPTAEGGQIEPGETSGVVENVNDAEGDIVKDIVKCAATSQDSIFSQASPKSSFDTNIGSPVAPKEEINTTTHTSADNLLVTPKPTEKRASRGPRFSFTPPVLSSTPKRSLDDTPKLNAWSTGFKPEDIPDFDDDLSFMESPASAQKLLTSGDTPRVSELSSPMKTVRSLVDNIENDDYVFSDDFSYMPEEDNDESPLKRADLDTPSKSRRKSESPSKKFNTPSGPAKPLAGSPLNLTPKETPTRRSSRLSTVTGADASPVEGSKEPQVSVDNESTVVQENSAEGALQQASESPERATQRTPLGEVAESNTYNSKRKIGDITSSAAPTSSLSEEAEQSEVPHVSHKKRRRSLRLSYLDSAASTAEIEVEEEEPQGDIYFTPERKNLNPLFTECPDSVQAKRKGRRRSLGQRRESLELETNQHIYTRIQAAVRGYIYRTQLQPDRSESKAAADVIISAWRGSKQRGAYLAQRSAAITIQRAYRRMKQNRQMNEEKSQKAATGPSDGPFTGLLKRFDDKKAAEAVASEAPRAPRLSKGIQTSNPGVYTPRPRRITKNSPFPANLLHGAARFNRLDDEMVSAYSATEAPFTALPAPPVKASNEPVRAPVSRIPKSGLRPPTVTGLSSKSMGKRKAEDDVNEQHVNKHKAPAPSAALTPRGRSLSKAPSSSIPRTRVAPGTISLGPKRLIKESLAKMTQPEITQMTNRHTEKNRKYNIDFERKIVRVERDRSSSPDAKEQHRRAYEDRMKRLEHQEETGIVLGPGDPMDFEPEMKTPSKKGVRWHSELEFGWDTEPEKHTPKTAKRKAKDDIKGIVKRKVPLDAFGNVAGPLPQSPEAMTVEINKVLYKGEEDDQ